METIAPNKMTAAARRPLVADMFLKKMTKAAIADHFGVSETTIRNDIKHMRAEWKKLAVEKFDGYVEESLAEIDVIKQVAWKEFELSKQAKMVIEQKRGTDRSLAVFKDSNGRETSKLKPNTDLVTRRTETDMEGKDIEQPGDVAYLKQVQWCIQETLKIIGGYASDTRANKKMADDAAWRKEVVEGLRSGEFSVSDVRDIWPETWQELVSAAGVDVVAEATV